MNDALFKSLKLLPARDDRDISSVINVINACAILFIWVIPHTIALRHGLLAIGLITSLVVIYRNISRFQGAVWSWAPLVLMGGIFFWVGIHYTYFSLNPELELSEIKGLWARSFVGAIIAIGLAISITKYSTLRLYFYIFLFSTPLINVLSYCWASYLNHGLVDPNAFFRFLFTKIETAYFGAIAASVAAGNLISLTLGKIDKSKALQILWWLLGLALILVSALVSSTKNGMAVALGLCALLGVVVLINTILHKGGSKVLSVIVLIVIVLLSAGIWEAHKSVAIKGWDTVFQDAALGIDIDTNKQWQMGEGNAPMPINSLGVPAAMNTYYRFSYAAVGTRLIGQFPLGYGSINKSFSELQSLAQIPHEHQGQVHSGWIDFGLAYGIPGLLLIFSSMLSIIYFGLKSKSSVALPWVIFCFAFIPFGLIAEITWKQYFEATIFFLSLGSTVVIMVSSKRT